MFRKGARIRILRYTGRVFSVPTVNSATIGTEQPYTVCARTGTARHPYTLSIYGHGNLNFIQFSCATKCRSSPDFFQPFKDVKPFLAAAPAEEGKEGADLAKGS